MPQHKFHFPQRRWWKIPQDRAKWCQGRWWSPHGNARMIKLMIKKPAPYHPPLDPCLLFAAASCRPAPGPHAKEALHLLTKLFVCFPYDPRLRADACGWFSAAGPGLSVPSFRVTSFGSRPRRVPGLSATQHLWRASLCTQCFALAPFRWFRALM